MNDSLKVIMNGIVTRERERERKKRCERETTEPWMNPHAEKWQEVGHGLLFHIAATRRRCFFPLRVESLHFGLFDHTLGRFEVAAPCHTCVPTEWMARGRRSDSEGAERTESHTRADPRQLGKTFTGGGRRKKRRSWRRWTWHPWEVIVLKPPVSTV